MADFADIIARLEKATGPDQELNCAIWLAEGGPGFEHRARHIDQAPDYTASIDDALTLKPDTWEFVLWTENGMVEAYPIKGVKRPAGIQFRIQGHDLALALCIAALKARAAQTPPQREGGE